MTVYVWLAQLRRQPLRLRSQAVLYREVRGSNPGTDCLSHASILSRSVN